MPVLSARIFSWAAHAVLVITTTVAARASDSMPHLEIDSEAKKIMNDFGNYYKRLSGFSVTIESQISASQSGLGQSTAKLRLSAARPNKLALSAHASYGEASNRLIVMSDGISLAAAFVDNRPAHGGRYAVEKGPDTWQAISSHPAIGALLAATTIVPVPTAILSDDPAAIVLLKSKSVKYGGREILNGIECHVIRSVADSSTTNAGGDFDWQLWIEAGERPLVRQSKVTSGEISSKFLTMTILSTFVDWTVNPQFTDDAFVFTRPEGSTTASSCMEVLTGKPAVNNPASSVRHPLLGQPAPSLTLDLLDGGTLDLASLKNESIVMLDFWSTSCLTCIQSLPIVEGVAQEFKAKGVRLFAVNVGQTADEARTFLEKVRWSGQIPIPLDKKKEAARAYSVSSMPHLVLIGKDGVVHAVRVGKSDALASQLRSDLELLLAGKNLAAKELVSAKTRDPEKDATK